MDTKQFYAFYGVVKVSSKLSINEIGNKISKELLSGACFIEKRIDEDINSIYFKILGLKIQIYEGRKDENGVVFYDVNIQPLKVYTTDSPTIQLNRFLYVIFADVFKNDNDLAIIEWHPPAL